MARGEWISHLEQMFVDCTEAADDEQSRLLREAADLLRRAPVNSAASFGLIPADGSFESLLDHGAWESAAIELLGPEAGYMLSRGNGSHLASVFLPGMSEDVTAEGASAALALMAAQMAALVVVTPRERRAVPRDNSAAGTRLN